MLRDEIERNITALRHAEAAVALQREHLHNQQRQLSELALAMDLVRKELYSDERSDRDT